MGLSQTNLEKLDFSALYEEQMKCSTFKSKNSQDWDKKANSMNESVHKSAYTQTFIDKMDITHVSSLLDVGCGPGTISLAMASKLKEVYALDYSQKMLDFVEENAKKQNLTNVKTLHTSWYDSWENVPKADIVVASRSMEVKDIKDALLKLNSKANKRVYLTTKVGGSFVDAEILNQLQREIFPRPDYIYILNVLHNMGIYAKVDFIESQNSRFESLNEDEFIEKISWSLGQITKEEKEVLKNYFNTTYRNKKETNFLRWAFISWEVKKNREYKI
ncbi:MAG: class I SAM-dependent methyltransferase [Arcobacteraceae bacterium]